MPRFDLVAYKKGNTLYKALAAKYYCDLFLGQVSKSFSF